MDYAPIACRLALVIGAAVESSRGVFEKLSAFGAEPLSHVFFGAVYSDHVLDRGAFALEPRRPATGFHGR